MAAIGAAGDLPEPRGSGPGAEAWGPRLRRVVIVEPQHRHGVSSQAPDGTGVMITAARCTRGLAAGIPRRWGWPGDRPGVLHAISIGSAAVLHTGQVAWPVGVVTRTTRPGEDMMAITGVGASAGERAAAERRGRGRGQLRRDHRPDRPITALQVPASADPHRATAAAAPLLRGCLACSAEGQISSHDAPWAGSGREWGVRPMRRGEP